MSSSSESSTARREIAALAARLIAEEGEAYGSAKRRAARQLYGARRLRHESWPDNQLVEDELRQYQQIFMADEQPQRLKALRRVALAVMLELECFDPRVGGAVLNGTAGEHSDIHLSLHADSSKDIEIFLLNHDISYQAWAQPAPGGRGQTEVLSFVYRNEHVHLACDDPIASRQVSGPAARREMASIAELRTLLAAESNEDTE